MGGRSRSARLGSDRATVGGLGDGLKVTTATPVTIGAGAGVFGEVTVTLASTGGAPTFSGPGFSLTGTAKLRINTTAQDRKSVVQGPIVQVQLSNGSLNVLSGAATLSGTLTVGVTSTAATLDITNATLSVLGVGLKVTTPTPVTIGAATGVFGEVTVTLASTGGAPTFSGPGFSLTGTAKLRINTTA